MEDDIKRWTATRKAALVMEIIQGKTTVVQASRSFDLPPSDIEEWGDDAKKGIENALRAKPLEVKEQSERQLKELQEVHFVPQGHQSRTQGSGTTRATHQSHD